MIIKAENKFYIYYMLRFLYRGDSALKMCISAKALKLYISALYIHITVKLRN